MSSAVSSPRSGRLVAPARRRVRAWRISRETCICETPIRSPISAWVRSLAEAQSQHRALALADARRAAARASRAPRRGRNRSSSRRARRRGFRRPPRGRREERRASRRDRRPSASSASSTCSSEASTASAISPTEGERRRPTPRARDRLVDAQGQLLQIARHPHRPGAIAEVALELAEDRRHGVAREHHLARACRSGRPP